MHSPNLPIGTSSSFSISARLAHLKDARAWLDRILLQANYPLVERQNVVTAVSELATNVIKHGSPSADTVNVEFRVNGEGEYIIIRDNGGEFKDYATFAQAGLEVLNNSDLLESGMGLAITRQLFPNQRYVPAVAAVSGLNELWIVVRERQAAAVRRSVALVDDDAAIRQVIEYYLTGDYDVISFSDATSAMKYLAINSVSVVISDINMPDMSGMELRQALAKNPRTDLVPFIFLTGDTNLSTQDAAVDLGVDDYLVKPVRKGQLLSVLKRILKRAEGVKTNLNNRLDENITAALCPEVSLDYGPFRIVSRTRNAKAGGGDFLFSHETEQSLLVVLGDIMGHGEQAKFFAHAHAGYFHGLANATNSDLPPSEYLKKLSDAIGHSTVLEATLVTCVAVRLGRDGSMAIASAGHPAPWRVTESGVNELNVGGTLPGLVDDVDYQEAEVDLDEDRLVLYTDGLIECGNSKQERAKLYDLMRARLGGLRSTAIDQAARLTMLMFDEFTAGQAGDDATLVMIEKRR